MKSISLSPTQGAELEQKIGDIPSLQWLINCSLEMIRTQFVPPLLYTKAERWLTESSRRILECRNDPSKASCSGVNPTAKIKGMVLEQGMVLVLFKEYGLIDDIIGIEEFDRRAREAISAQKTENARHVPS